MGDCKDYKARDLVSMLQTKDESEVVVNLITKGNLDNITSLCTAIVSLEDDWSVFTLAAHLGRTDIISALCLLPESNVMGYAPKRRGKSALHYASAGGNTDVVKCLLASGANVNSTCRISRWSSVHYAASAGYTDTLGRLLESTECDIDARTKEGHTPLYLAARNGHVNSMKYLLKQGADYKITFAGAQTLLQVVSERGHLDCVKLLFDLHKADKNDLDQNVGVSLYEAALHNHYNLCEWLLTFQIPGGAANRMNPRGHAPIHAASSGGHCDIIKLLLAGGGGNVNLVNRRDWTAVHFAAKHDNSTCLQLLNEHHADLMCTTSEGYNLLHVACMNTSQQVVAYVLAACTSPQLKALCLAYDARGLCPLHHEVLNGGVATETAESLKRIQSKSGEWPRTQRGDNMLMLAAKCDRLDVLQTLVKLYPSLTSEDNGDLKSTVLHFLAKTGRIEMLESLLSNRKLDTGLGDAHQWTALHHACVVDSPVALDTLMRMAPAANVNQRTVKGYTCLHLAVITDKLNIARKLLEQYNACPDLHDHLARSALHYCKCADMFTLLLQEGQFDLNQCDSRDRTPLHSFVENRYSLDRNRLLALVETALEVGDDHVSPRDCFGLNVASTAVCCLDNTQTTLAVLAALTARWPKGNIINDADNEGNTTLHYACDRNIEITPHTTTASTTASTTSSTTTTTTTTTSTTNTTTSTTTPAEISRPSTGDILCLTQITVELVDGPSEDAALAQHQLAYVPNSTSTSDTSRDSDYFSSEGPRRLAPPTGDTHPSLRNATDDDAQDAARGRRRRSVATRRLSVSPGGAVTSTTGVIDARLMDGVASIVGFCLLQRPLVNAKNSDGLTPLILAVCRNNYQVVEMLLNQPDIDVNASDTEMNTALHFGADLGHRKIVEMLIDHSANIDSLNCESISALYCATKTEDIFLVELLANQVKDINHKVDDGYAAVHIAAQNGDFRTLECLISAKADVDCLDTMAQWTPLLFASQNGHMLTVRILLDNEASVNHCGCDGVDSLFLAIQNGHLEVAEHLLKSGASPDNLLTRSREDPGRDPTGSPTPAAQSRGTSPTPTTFTPLYSAAQRGDLHAVQLLLYYGAAVDGATAAGNGYAPLHTAAANGHRRVVECLLNGGASVVGGGGGVEEEEGDSAVIDAASLALSNGHDELATILRCHTAADPRVTERDRRSWMKYIKNVFNN